MKSCYIANCDKTCGYDGSRSMFMVPSDPTAMKNWTAVIPVNKRPLIKSDRICNRHFLESDIEKCWEHVINGEVAQMDRARPRLKKGAVPSQNLNIALSDKLKKKRVEVSKKSPGKEIKKFKKVDVIEAIVAPIQNVEYETEEIFVEIETTEEQQEDPIQKNDEQTEEVRDNKKTKRPTIRKVPPKKSDEKKREDFEALYEEVFAVQLPSQLWGIHRCPDMKFMAFSRFDTSSLIQCDIVVHITDVWEYSVYFKGIKVKQDFLSVMTEDSITVLLDEVDSTKYIVNNKGQVQVKRKYNRQ